jgi:hypothetical protein
MDNVLLFALNGMPPRYGGRKNVGRKSAENGPMVSFDTPLRGKAISFEAALSTVHRLHGALELGCSAG